MLNPDDIKAGYTLGHADALILRELVEKTRWIPVGERLPEDDIICLGIDNDGIAWTVHFEDGQFVPDTGSDELNITHWMPLPEPPA